MTRILIQPKHILLLWIFEMIRIPLSFLTCTNRIRILQFRRTLVHSNTCCFSKHTNCIYIYLSFIFSCNLNQSIRLLCFVLSIYRAQRPYHRSIRLLCFVISYAWTHLHLNVRARTIASLVGSKTVQESQTETRTERQNQEQQRMQTSPKDFISLKSYVSFTLRTSPPFYSAKKSLLHSDLTLGFKEYSLRTM
jgi:hypothetical protein